MPDIPQLDSTISVVTPENISFDYRVAGPFQRLPAYLLDLMLAAVLFLFIQIGLSLTLGWLGSGLATGASLIIWFAIFWFYGGIFETWMNGQTPGKRLMGLRVLTVDGTPINGMQAVMRNVLRLADSMPLLSLEVLQIPVPVYVIPTFVLGVAVMAVNRRYQRLGDIVCGTLVVVEEPSWRLSGVAKIDDSRAAQLAEFIPPNFRVSRTLARALASYVDRRRFLSRERRSEIASPLADPLLQQFQLPPDTSPDLLLCSLYLKTFVSNRVEGAPRKRAANDSPFTNAESV